jgi:hypothetical protein
MADEDETVYLSRYDGSYCGFVYQKEFYSPNGQHSKIAGSTGRHMRMNPERLKPGRIAEKPLPDGCEEFPNFD